MEQLELSINENNELIIEKLNINSLNLEEFIKNNIKIEGNINLSKNGNAKYIIKKLADEINVLSNKEDKSVEDNNQLNNKNLELNLLEKYFEIKKIEVNRFDIYYNYNNFFIVDTEVKSENYNIKVDLENEFNTEIYIESVEEFDTENIKKINIASVEVDLSYFDNDVITELIKRYNEN